MASKIETAIPATLRSIPGWSTAIRALSVLLATVNIRQGAWRTIRFFSRDRRRLHTYAPIEIDLKFSDPGLGDFLMDLVLAGAVADAIPGVRLQ